MTEKVARKRPKRAVVEETKPLGKKKVAGAISINTQIFRGKELVKEISSVHALPGKMVTTPHSTVGLEAGVTVNMGNYENIKVTVSRTDPCDSNDDAADKQYAQTNAWVERKVVEKAEEMKVVLGDLRG